jgi:phosphoglycolate phosphatase
MNGFRWREFDAYLFDIDGTLLNSRDGVHYYAFHNAMRAVLGRDIRIDGVPVHGNTDIGILKAATRLAGISDELIESRLAGILEHMCEEVERNASQLRPELCPSVTTLLESLHADGKLLGIVSGNLEPIGWKKLEAAGVRRFFSFGSFSDRHETRVEIFRWGADEVRRRLGTDATVCFIGDTPADIAAARTLGLPVVAVATGIFPFEELQSSSPDVCISCCNELLQV